MHRVGKHGQVPDQEQDLAQEQYYTVQQWLIRPHAQEQSRANGISNGVGSYSLTCASCDMVTQQHYLDKWVNSAEVAELNIALKEAQREYPIGVEVAKTVVEETLKVVRSRIWGLMLCADAQTTDIVHVKNFLNQDDIDEVHAVAHAVQIDGIAGILQCDCGTHNVAYLHTEGFFAKRLSHLLRHKIRSAIESVDAGS